MFRCVAAFVLCARLLVEAQTGTLQNTVPPPRLPTTSDALQAAIRAGELDETKRLLESGADVNSRDSFGNTPLLYAAFSGNADIVACLLAHGADVNAPEAGPPILGHSVLEGAILAGRTEVVKLLIPAGAPVNRTFDDEGRTPLQLAARYGHAGIAEVLLAAHAAVDPADATDHTALDIAVLYGQTSVVPVLLRHGADPRRVRPQDGRGPLHEACIKGSAALIDLLINAGAPPAERDKSGQTPLDLALAYQNRAAIGALERLSFTRPECRTAAANAIETATVRGQTEIVRLLLDGGFDLRRSAPDRSTYLHQAALHGRVKLVRLFLDRGADPNALDGSGGTPLHSAALAGSTEVISLLLDRGGRIDVADHDSGATPLMLAASLSRTEAVALLLKRGAHPLLRDRAGRTALDRARETDDIQAVKLLETAHGVAPSTAKPTA